MKSLIERIKMFVEANPWHSSGGKFSSAKKLAKNGKGSYSKKGKKYAVGKGSSGPYAKKVNKDCGRDDRPQDATRCRDEKVPEWSKERYGDSDRFK